MPFNKQTKRSFFQAAVVSILLYGCTIWTLTDRLKKEARWQLHKNVESNIEQFLEATPHKTPQDIKIPQDISFHDGRQVAVQATCLPSRKLYKLDEPDMQDNAGEARTSSSVMYSYGPPHMAKQKQDDQLEHTYSSYVRIRM